MRTNEEIPSIQDIIKTLDLCPHPEGGYFRESYRSKGKIPRDQLPVTFKGDRHFSTAIYFLLGLGQKSKWHRIHSDEIWHFYLGSPLSLKEITSDGQMKKTIIGPQILSGQKVQYVVPAGNWFAASPLPGHPYSFVGCTVAPGFDFADFELIEDYELAELFPHLEKELLWHE